MNVIKRTKSICPICFQEIEATVFEEDNKVYMLKKCLEHGEFKALLEEDYAVYSKFMNKKPNGKLPPVALMLPITHKCNLSCKVCFLPCPNQKEISLDEIKRLIKDSDDPEIRISGGEPTLRKDLPEIIKYTNSIGKRSYLLTNGTTLDDKHAKMLKDNGITAVHFSLNALNNDNLKRIDGKPLLEKKLKSIEVLKKHNIPIILSTLLVREVNKRELRGLLDFYLKNHKFISQWRIRSSVQIGRYTGTQPYVVSELIELIYGLVGLKKEDLLKSYSKAKNYRSIPCMLNIRMFFYALHGKYEFVLAEPNTMDVRKLASSKIKKFYFAVKILRQRGLKALLGYASNRVKDKGKLVHCDITLRSWPSKYTIDMVEMTYCHSNNLCEDGIVRPFCYGLVLNENLVRKDNSK